MSEPLTAALRQEGPQQEELRKIIARMYAYVGKGSTEDAHVIANWATELEDALPALSASRTAQAPQQALIARLTDYRAQVLNGFRHISRLEEAELIQAAIDGLRPPVAPAEGEK